MRLEFKDTGRGFQVAEFKDRYGELCSVQESSIATEPCIWLGQHRTTCSECGHQEPSRMHLTPEMAAALVPVLQEFVDTGEIGRKVRSVDTTTVLAGTAKEGP